MAKAGAIISVFFLVVIVAIAIAVYFVVYSIAHDVKHQTRQKLERKNISFSRQGMKVGVKEVTVEQQEDATQSVITKIWSNSSWPAYKSRLGWGQANAPVAENRAPFSRHSSSASQVPTISRHSSSSTNPSRTTSAQPNPSSRTTSAQNVKSE